MTAHQYNYQLFNFAPYDPPSPPPTYLRSPPLCTDMYTSVHRTRRSPRNNVHSCMLIRYCTLLESLVHIHGVYIQAFCRNLQELTFHKCCFRCIFSESYTSSHHVINLHNFQKQRTKRLWRRILVAIEYKNNYLDKINV